MYNFTFGIRTVAFRSGKLYVNGEMTRLKGLAFSGSADEYTFNDSLRSHYAPDFILRWQCHLQWRTPYAGKRIARCR